jgi:hypothetical protein
VKYDTVTRGCPGTWPAPSFKYGGPDIRSGQSATGNICYLIASNDADSLMLYTYAEDGSGRTIWFALR